MFILFRANPGCLGNLGHFKNNFSDPIEKGQRHSATKRALATGRKTVRALVRKIAPFFLRRTKALIKEQLPKKDDRVSVETLKSIKYLFELFSVFKTMIPYRISLVCFVPGSVLLSDRLSANCLSGSAGH